MTAIPKRIYTEEEYLELERASDVKHEFYRGEIFAMAGGSNNHNIIVPNLLAALRPQVRKRACILYSSDMRVKIPKTKHYVYPDASVVCGTPEFSNEPKDAKDTLLNPTIVFEVLSPATQDYDRGTKFVSYRTLKSLKEYVVISQDKAHIEHHVRQPDDTWVLQEFNGLAAQVKLPSIDGVLKLVDVYEDIKFEEEES